MVPLCTLRGVRALTRDDHGARPPPPIRWRVGGDGGRPPPLLSWAGTRPGRPLCTNKKAKQKARENPTAQRRTRAPPSRSEGRGRHLAPRPHTLAAGWAGLARPTTAVSPRFRQANLGIDTTSQRGRAGCRRRSALGPAPRKGLPKEGPSATNPRACSSAVVGV